jgi:hypothetical protein
MSADEDRIQADFAATQGRWRQAVYAHRMAPPDAGFSARLADLAAVAAAQAAVLRKAAAAGYSWPPHATTVEQPYELRPGTGRRGPGEVWQRFDAAVEVLNRAAATMDVVQVAAAHEALARVAGDLAVEVEREDRASGLLTQLDVDERRSA